MQHKRQQHIDITRGPKFRRGYDWWVDDHVCTDRLIELQFVKKFHRAMKFDFFCGCYISNKVFCFADIPLFLDSRRYPQRVLEQCEYSGEECRE